MELSTKLDLLHAKVKGNKWHRYFAIFIRIALAYAFIASGSVKIMGERFTSLSSNHPMGHYLEALHTTAYYYTFIGIAQVTAAVLLLIPRTALLGALIYFPIILNICILSIAVRFDGSLVSSPLMVLANLYLLCWYYDRLKFVLPFKKTTLERFTQTEIIETRNFPKFFFAGVLLTMVLVGVTTMNVFDVRPRNTIEECNSQFKGTNRTKAGAKFCDCIFSEAQPLDKSLDAYHKAPNDSGK